MHFIYEKSVWIWKPVNKKRVTSFVRLLWRQTSGPVKSFRLKNAFNIWKYNCSVKLWSFDTVFFKSSFVIASNSYKLWSESEVILLFFVGSALTEQSNKWLVRTDRIKCLFLVGHYLIIHAAGTYFCASSDSSFAVVPFHPAHLICAGCRAIIVGIAHEHTQQLLATEAPPELALPAQGVRQMQTLHCCSWKKDVHTHITTMSVVWWGGEH